MDAQEVKEILELAQDYVDSLESQLVKLQCAENQITTSSKDTKLMIDDCFQVIKESIMTRLQKRKLDLCAELDKITDESLSSILECREVIQDKLNKSRNLLAIGSDIMLNPTECRMNTFNNNAQILGNVPEVPENKNMPNFSFCNYDDSHFCFLDAIPMIGTLFEKPPVEISQIVPKPGGFLLEFSHHCEDHFQQHSCVYRLQISDEITSFKDYYSGPSITCQVKNLATNKIYSFRVCCKIKESKWSPWSAIERGSTPFCSNKWLPNPHISLTSDDSIIKLDKDEDCTIYTNNLDISQADSLSFTVSHLYTSELEGNFLGICADDLKESLYVEFTGHVYLNNERKLIILSKFEDNTKIAFTYSQSNKGIMVHIDANNKRVTYIWNPCARANVRAFAKISRRCQIKIE